MSYRYFSQQLIDKKLLDLSQVFPDKQADAQKMGNVDYNLSDIVLYLQDVTDNFKLSDRKYIDLDNAVLSIIEKYYKSIGQPNPFEKIDSLAVKEDKDEIPREAAIVDKGKTTSKGVVKKESKKEEPKKAVTKEKVVTKTELPPVEIAPIEPIVVEAPIETMEDGVSAGIKELEEKIAKTEKAIANPSMPESAKQKLISQLEQDKEALEFLQSLV